MEQLVKNSAQANHAGGVAVAEGAQPTDSGQDTKPLTLIQRLANIRRESSGVGKEEIKMGSYNIKAHTIEGVLHGMRGLLDKHRVWVNPNLVEVKYGGNRCDVIVDFEWVNLDDEADTKTIRWAGADTDQGGKGFAKAGTNALKEMLKKTFLITDREDAKEETENVEHQTDEGLKRAQVEKAAETARKTQEQWAKTLKAAADNAGTKAALVRLRRENSEQLADLPPVTRAFFDDLFRSREAELEAAEKADAEQEGED